MSHIHTTMFFWSPLFVSTTVHSHLVSICAPVFSLGRLFAGRWSQAPAFQRHSKSSTSAKAIVSVKKISHVDDKTYWVENVFVFFIKATVQHLSLIGAILGGVLCHVLGALTDCSNFQNPQIMRPNAVVVLSWQNACMLGFTSAISDFSKLKTPPWSESLASGKTKRCHWYEHCTVMR